MAENRLSKKQTGEEKGFSFLAAGATAVTAMGLAAATAWIVYSNLVVDHTVPLPNAIPAERKSFVTPGAGRLSYYCDQQGQGMPLVLIHSVNAAASAYEMKPLFEHYRGKRPVYALDLPGFGFSERSKRAYSPRLYESAILEFMQSQVGEPADVIALSLGSEFAARAALDSPALFHSLSLISPSGLAFRQGEPKGSQQAAASGASRLIYPLFSFPLWGRPFYDLLTTVSSIRYFLEKSFVGVVPPELIEYDYLTAHQPGAENAPLHFVSGSLFTRDVRRQVYEQVNTRTLVVYDRDNFVRFDMLPDLLAKNPHWSARRVVPTLGLPQFEQLNTITEVLDQFWEEG